MNLKGFLKQILLGSSIPNEYVCMADDKMTGGLSVMLKCERDEVDVTTSHLLLGYKPLLVGLALSDEELVSWAMRNAEIRLSFRTTTTTTRELAWLELKKAGTWRMGDTNVFIYQGQRGGHEFMSPAYQWMNTLYELLRSHKAGNVSLNPKLYTQVRIAYAVPRKISLISVGSEHGYNIFPTDLHGSIGKNFYAGSLRIGSNASGQVEAHKKILIADTNVSAHQEAYSMGVNHMRDLRPREAFKTVKMSEQWRLPIPAHTVAYKELLWKDSWDCGIHRIHFYEVIGERIIDDHVARLYHIHRHYAQWRMDQKLSARYLLR